MNVFVWLMILVAFLVIEGLTAGLMTIWFAGGALVAALAAFLGATLVPQLLLFIGVSVVLLVFTRPLAIKHRKNDTTSTNVDSLIGTTAVVTEDIDNLAQKGQVHINDIDWLARSLADDIRIPKGSVVRICRVEGVKLIVEQKKEG